MKGGGVGGPLLCIGDLLSDVQGEDSINPPQQLHDHDETSISDFKSSHLPKLFQETYNQLNEALAGTDHSWTSLTLKLCGAVETANQLVQCTNANASVLSEKVKELEKIIKKGDAAISSAKSIYIPLNTKDK
ncbi:hypothetical protein ACFE04_025847 [Oxalis oulophora]